MINSEEQSGGDPRHPQQPHRQRGHRDDSGLPTVHLAESTQRAWQRRLDHELNAIMGLTPANPRGRRLRKRYGKLRSLLSTFLDRPDDPPDNNVSERELRSTATYRKVTEGFRSQWGADLFVAVRSVAGAAAQQGTNAYHAIPGVLDTESVRQAGCSTYRFSVSMQHLSGEPF